MKDFLAIIGLAALCAIGCFVVIGLWCALKELVDYLRRQYRYKHRFDKPPTAKCYCIDCKYHDSETRRCYRFGETTKEYRCTADNWFCWEAEPRKE